LIALLGLCAMLCGTTAPSADADAARTSRFPRTTSSLAQRGYMHTSPLARTSESEGEETEEELEEDEEGTATAEAEVEEAGSAEAGSPSNRAGDSGAAVLSRLRLTAQATVALERRHPSASTIAFSFTLSAPTKVRVTLLEQTGSPGRTHWATLPDSLTVGANRGRVSDSLAGHNHLAPGRYRLTVKPSGGRSRSIYLSARR
jgi:hypothetical protein